jgi:uncharacterized protein (DUF302 family)
MLRPLIVLASLAALLIPVAASADDATAPRAYTTTGAYADVRQEIEDGVVNAGLKIDYRGNIGEMLKRTGEDVGSTAEVYKNAEFFTFCSARLSRAAMEADPANLAVCPYVVYLYEPAAKPGEVTVGYRRPIGAPGDASAKAVAEIDSLLDGIVKSAAGK